MQKEEESIQKRLHEVADELKRQSGSNGPALETRRAQLEAKQKDLKCDLSQLLRDKAAADGDWELITDSQQYLDHGSRLASSMAIQVGKIPTYMDKIIALSYWPFSGASRCAARFPAGS